MKIGILTFHRANNYGAVLQCYALQEYLTRQGHNVEIIDYRQDFLEKIYRAKFSFFSFIKSCLKFNASSYFRVLEYKKNKEKCFNPFRTKYLNIRSIKDGKQIPLDYDVYIIGSDQMWSFQCVHGYDPIYWGNFARSQKSRLYGFSISGNGDFKGNIDDSIIKRNIENFNRISFREEKIRSVVKTIYNDNYPITIDPTLLTDSDFWDKIINHSWKNRKYLAFYQVRKSEHKEDIIFSKARAFAELNNLEFVDLNDGSYTVEDFVSAIKYAQYVVTSSFHATAFSLIHHTPFLSIALNDGHDDRYVDLLKNMNLSDRIIQFYEDIKIDSYIDSSIINEGFNSIRKETIDYLKEL